MMPDAPSARLPLAEGPATRLPIARAGTAWILVLGVLLAASSGFGVVWDETLYFDYADSVRAWADAGFPFDAASLARHWEYSAYHNPHPPLFKALSAVTAGWLPFPLGYRLPYAAFCAFGLVAGGLALARRFGPEPSVAGLALAALQPRVFGELLTAVSDGVVAITWLALPLILWAWDDEKDRRRRWLWGAAYVLVQVGGAGAKITALLAAAPLAAFCLAARRGRAFLLVVASGMAGLVSAPLWSPAHWGAPGSAIVDMVLYPLSRSSAPISLFYRGEVYYAGLHVPWHHFLVMTVATVPPILLLALPGLAVLRDARGLLRVLVAPLLSWVALEHLPGVPRHDGVRQFVAFFPLLGLLAWLGWEAGLARAIAAGVLTRGIIVRIVRFLPAAWLAAALAHAHPFELTWYSPAIGGVAGAERRGLELAYYLDPVRLALGWINAQAPPGSTVVLRPDWPDLLLRYQKEGLLRADLQVKDTLADADVVVVARRRALVGDAHYGAVPAVAEVRYDGVSLVKIMVVRRPPP